MSELRIQLGIMEFHDFDVFQKVGNPNLSSVDCYCVSCSYETYGRQRS